MTVSELFLDSSAWLAYVFGEKPEMRAIIDSAEIILTSALCVFEVKRKLLKTEKLAAERAVALIKERSVIMEVTGEIATAAADLAQQHKLAAMDALIYATAQEHNSILITGDHDFEGLEGVRILS